MRYSPVIPDFPHILHGGDYNPDQWKGNTSVINEDFQLMKQAHCNTFSVGIFAWTSIQPDENTWRFDWLDDIMDRMAANGNRILLGNI